MDSRLRIILLTAAVLVIGYFFLYKKHSENGTVAFADPAVPTVAQRGAANEAIPIQTGGLRGDVNTDSGALSHLVLTDSQFLENGAPMPLSSTFREYALPLRSNVRFTRNGVNVVPTYITFSPVHQTPTDVELVAQPAGSDLEIRRSIQARGQYAFNVDTTVINHGGPGRLEFSQSVFHFVRRSDEESHFFRQPWQRSEALCRHDGKLIREWREQLDKNGEMGARNAEFVGLGNLYFVNALAASGGDHADCLIRSDDTGDPSAPPTGSLLRGVLVWQPSQVGTDASRSFHVVGYFGPKYATPLAAASPALHEAVNLGFFSIIARGLLKLLQFLFSVFRNWGLAIIVLTVLVRSALYPILSRSTRSMAFMQKLKPEIDALNEKYKDNAEQRGLATMELYRKHKINPLAGCLPQMAQLPIWWALYTTLQTSVELFHAPFGGWLRDLSAPDPFYVLPLVLGAMMFAQQKLMPASMPDPAQQKMMLYFMPIFMTGISLFLPSGLALYMVVNSVLAMGQQKLTKMQIDRLVAATPGGGIEVRPVDDAGDAGSPKSGGRRGGRR